MITSADIEPDPMRPGTYRMRENTARMPLERARPPNRCPDKGSGAPTRCRANQGPSCESGDRQPNATEREFLRVAGSLAAIAVGGRYNCERFSVLDGSHTYTPDWTVSGVAVEVKGEYIHSRDGRILFDALRSERPDLTCVWARKRTGGKSGDRWVVEVWLGNGDKTTKRNGS